MRFGSLVGRAAVILGLGILSSYSPCVWAGQADAVLAMTALPDAPEPQAPAANPASKKDPCPAPKTPNGPVASPANPDPPAVAPQGGSAPCKMSWIKHYEHFMNGPPANALTPKDKAWLAARNMVDPFNTITILGEAAIAVGSDSHSAYGPGMPGYARYVGVSFTQELTGEFFGTFLIPSVVHQDPHYHRLPKAGIPHRIGHAMLQVVWTQGDTGKGMPNYANIVGFAIDDAISNLYVPGRETDASATGSRYAIGLASAPIGNFITEFLPDVASHIHVQVVIIQRIINQVAIKEGGGAGPP